MYGINDGLMQRRQAVGKAARLVTGTHIIPVLRQLRWLPVRADELSLKWPCLFSRHCVVLLHGVWWMTANSSLWRPPPSTTIIVRCCHVHNPPYLYSSRAPSCVCSCRTLHVCKTASQSNVSLGQFHRALKTAPSDFCFECADYKFSYLLTYLLTCR